MRFPELIFCLALTGLGTTTACTAESTLSEREAAITSPETLPAELEGCQWQCITCVPGECESECFPSECEIPDGCGFIAVCLEGYQWDEDECTCLPTDDDGGNGKGHGHDKDGSSCQGVVICLAGMTWDPEACACLPDTPAARPNM